MTVTTGGRRLSHAERIQASVAAAVACGLCPDITPEVGIRIVADTSPRWGGWSASAPTRARAEELVEDPRWRARALGWITAYWTAHGHGPTWSEFFWEPTLPWPDELASRGRRLVLMMLCQQRLLDGTKTPFGLRVRDVGQSRMPAARQGRQPVAPR